MAYQAPVRNHLFILGDVLGLEGYADLPGFADASLETVEQILTEGARFCEEVLAPINRAGDLQGCQWSPQGVTTPPGFKQAYAAMVEAGWPLLSSETEYGGQGLPGVVGLAYSEMSSSANMAFSMYPGLTHGAYSAILTGGTDAQKQLYLPRLASGAWGGTMNLTEPHCGTDLGLLRTKAALQADGSYRISGQKIWISGGEHDLAENIVHLVLARIDGAPEGVKGISLFIVPKFLPDAEGGIGARNAGVQCAGLEHKMGIHGNATCVMAYDEAQGWLIGEANAGLKLMFVMMNEARMGVALQGLSQGEAAYQAAAAFAKERLQGRALTGPKNPDGPADPILVHPDVRRMLMDSKAVLEAGRALLLWAGLQGDLVRVSPDAAVREKAADLMGLMVPVLKAYLTDRGFKIASDAMQVHGGSGFTEHYPASQHLRDVRISMIYEGTNGVQAMDLVGRKLPAHGGRAPMAWFAELEAFVAEHEGQPVLAPFVEGLKTAKGQLQEATMWLMQHGMQNPDDAGAAATDYLHLFALTAMAWMWTRLAKAAQTRIDAGDSDPFYARKLVVGRYFVDRLLPDAGAHLAKLKAGSASLMALEAEGF